MDSKSLGKMEDVDELIKFDKQIDVIICIKKNGKGKKSSEVFPGMPNC